MGPYSFFFSVIVPGLLMLAYGLIKTRKPLASEALWAGFLAGLLVAMGLMAGELGIARLLPLDHLPPLAKAGARAVLVAAIPEEGVKFCALLLVIRRYVYPDDAAATIIAALGVALGFAVMEDAFYVLRAFSVSAIGGSMVAVGRALTAVPGHVVFGLTMGALVAAARGGGHAELTENPVELVPALLLPVVMHGAYDFLLMAHNRLDPTTFWTVRLVPLVMAASVLSAILLCNVVLRHAARFDHPGPEAPRAPAWLGCFFVVLGLLMVWLMLDLPALQLQQALAMFCVVPLLFGLDLMWTAFGRMRRAVPSTVAHLF